MPKSNTNQNENQSTVQVPAPESGVSIAIASEAGGNLTFDFDPANATASRIDNNLVFQVDGGGTVTLEGFFEVGDQSLPTLTLPDGAVVAATDFFAGSDLDLSTAAGPGAGSPSSGGANYDDDGGALLGGIDRLGSLGTDYWGRGTEITEGAGERIFPTAGIDISIVTDLSGSVAPGMNGSFTNVLFEDGQAYQHLLGHQNPGDPGYDDALTPGQLVMVITPSAVTTIDNVALSGFPQGTRITVDGLDFFESTGTDDVLNLTYAQSQGQILVYPPVDNTDADYTVNWTVTMSAPDYYGVTESGSFVLVVDAVADKPHVDEGAFNANPVIDTQDHTETRKTTRQEGEDGTLTVKTGELDSIDFPVSVRFSDLDGSEFHTIEVTGVPSDWTLEPAENSLGTYTRINEEPFDSAEAARAALQQSGGGAYAAWQDAEGIVNYIFNVTGQYDEYGNLLETGVSFNPHDWTSSRDNEGDPQGGRQGVTADIEVTARAEEVNLSGEDVTDLNNVAESTVGTYEVTIVEDTPDFKGKSISILSDESAGAQRGADEISLWAFHNDKSVQKELAALREGDPEDPDDGYDIPKNPLSVAASTVHYDLHSDGTNDTGGDSGLAFLGFEGFEGAYSGWKTTAGEEIYLHYEDGNVIGATKDGTVAFVVIVEGSLTSGDHTGLITFIQYESLEHPKAGDGDKGSYNEEMNFDLKLTLVLTDDDGDKTSIKVNINVRDDGPTAASSSTVHVYETDLDSKWATGTDDNHTMDNDGDGKRRDDESEVSGKLVFDYGADGPHSEQPFTWNIPTGKGNNLQAYNEKGQLVNVTWELSADGLALKGYVVSGYGRDAVKTPVITVSAEVDANGNVSYTIDLLNNIYHDQKTWNGDIDSLNITYTIMDGDGDTATGNITVTVVDDAPVVGKSASATVWESELRDGTQASEADRVTGDDKNDDGNKDDSVAIAKGALNIDFGADGPAKSGGFVWDTPKTGEYKTSEGVDIQWKLADNGQTLIGYTKTGSHGQETVVIIIEATGIGTDNPGYTVTLKESIQHGKDDAETDNSLDLNIGFTVKDADGDTATGAITVTVVDDAPVVELTAPAIQHVLTITNHGETEAEYKSSFGYYIKNPDGTPKDGVILWANTKETEGTSAGEFQLTGYTEDQIGFFLIPDGASQNNGLSDMAEVYFQQDELGNWQAFLKEGNIPLTGNGGSNLLFDNADLNVDGKSHITDNAAPGNQNWEDTVGGDDDYNDVNISISWTSPFPESLITKDSHTDGDPTDEDSVTVDFGKWFAVSDNTSPGADGYAQGTDGPAITYALTLNDDDSGLTSGGHSITLVVKDDGIVGQIEVDGVTTGIFKISINAETGEVTLTQYKAVDHWGEDADGNNANNSANLVTLKDGSITFTATATVVDGDGDTASDSRSFDISNAFGFKDDVPVIELVSGAAGGITEAKVSVVGTTETVVGSWSFDFGADGPNETGGVFVTLGKGEFVQAEYDADANAYIAVIGNDTVKLYVDDTGKGGNVAFISGTDADRTDLTLEVQIQDRDGDIANTDTGITFNVNSSNRPPTAHDNFDSVNEDIRSTTGNVLTDSYDGNVDVDPDGDTLTVTTTDTMYGKYGSITINADGSYEYNLYAADDSHLTEENAAKLEALFNSNTQGDECLADEVFTYTISDGRGGTDTAELRIEIEPNKLIVGTSGNDTLVGGQGDDVIVGDPGGMGMSTSYASYNLAVVIDTSGSMEDNMNAAKLALMALVKQYAEYGSNEGATVNLAIIGFAQNSSFKVQDNDLNLDDLKASTSAVANSFATFEHNGKTVTVGATSDWQNGRSLTLIDDNSDYQYRISSSGVLQYSTNGSNWKAVADSTSLTWYSGDAITNIFDMSATGGTNYEAGLNAANHWFGEQDNGYTNVLYFITDGAPTYYYSDSAQYTTPLEQKTSNGLLDGATATVTIGSGYNKVTVNLVYHEDGTIADDSSTYSFRFNPSGSGQLQYSTNNGKTWTTVSSNTTWTNYGPVCEIPGDYWVGVEVYYDAAGNVLKVDYDTTTTTSVPSDAAYRIDSSGAFQHLDGKTWKDVTDILQGNGSTTNQVEEDQSEGAYQRLLAELGSNNVAINTIGIGLSESTLDYLNKLDNTGGAQFINSAADLKAALDAGSTTPEPEDAGNDTITGGAGSDILFGDALTADWLLNKLDSEHQTITLNGQQHTLAKGDSLHIVMAYLHQTLGRDATSDDLRLFIEDNAFALGQSESIRGGGDTLNGGDGDDWLFGQGGDDVLDGGAGNDILVGGSGDDTLTGGDGADIFVFHGGETGSNTITDFNAAEGDIIVKVGSGEVTITGDHTAGDIHTVVDIQQGSDITITNSANHMLVGTHGNDTLTGGAGDDIIVGGRGNDTLVGGDGNDVLFGGDGNDVLFGGSGNDLLHGGTGDDILFGGSGSDTFAWSLSDFDNGKDTIMDFAQGEDIIRLNLGDLVSGNENDLGALLSKITWSADQSNDNILTLTVAGNNSPAQTIEVHFEGDVHVNGYDGSFADFYAKNGTDNDAMEALVRSLLG